MQVLSHFEHTLDWFCGMDVRDYRENGYTIVRKVIDPDLIDRLLSVFLRKLASAGGPAFTDAHDPELANCLREDTGLQTRVYDAMKEGDHLVGFAQQSKLVEAIRRILGGDIVLMRKIPFRIDVPMELKELAIWHQDYFYVRGNIDIVTAWIPMQTTTVLEGCISVMPGSHELGPLEHSVKVLDKRDMPNTPEIFDRVIRYAPVEKGDAILFHSCLLHSSNVNLSDTVRFSMQSRYSRVGWPTDPGMGEVLSI